MPPSKKSAAPKRKAGKEPIATAPKSKRTKTTQSSTSVAGSPSASQSRAASPATSMRSLSIGPPQRPMYGYTYPAPLYSSSPVGDDTPAADKPVTDKPTGHTSPGSTSASAIAGASTNPTIPVASGDSTSTTSAQGYMAPIERDGRTFVVMKNNKGEDTEMSMDFETHGSAGRESTSDSDSDVSKLDLNEGFAEDVTEDLARAVAKDAVEEMAEDDDEDDNEDEMDFEDWNDEDDDDFDCDDDKDLDYNDDD